MVRVTTFKYFFAQFSGAILGRLKITINLSDDVQFFFTQNSQSTPTADYEHLLVEMEFNNIFTACTSHHGWSSWQLVYHRFSTS